MTKYEEMSEAFANARQEFWAYKDRSLTELNNFIRGFEAFCEIPHEQIKLLRWNGPSGDNSPYTEAEEGMVWFLPATVNFDEEDGLWRMGLSITLSRKGVSPRDWVAFGIRVSENHGRPTIQFGNVGKPQALDQEGSAAYEALYHSLIEIIVKSFAHRGAKPVSRNMGFQVSSL